MSVQGRFQGWRERIVFSFGIIPAACQSPSTGGLGCPGVPPGVGTSAMQNIWGTIELSKIALQPRAGFACPLWAAGLLSTGWDWARNLVLSFYTIL